MTTWPDRAPPSPPDGTSTRCVMRGLSGTRYATPASTCSRPTTSRVRRSSTSTIDPCGLPRYPDPSTRTATRSPCITSRICWAARNTGGEPSSGSSKPSPLRFALTVPTTSPGSCSRRQNCPRRLTTTSPARTSVSSSSSACAALAGPSADFNSSRRSGRPALRSTVSTAFGTRQPGARRASATWSGVPATALFSVFFHVLPGGIFCREYSLTVPGTASKLRRLRRGRRRATHPCPGGGIGRRTSFRY